VDFADGAEPPLSPPFDGVLDAGAGVVDVDDELSPDVELPPSELPEPEPEPSELSDLADGDESPPEDFDDPPLRLSVL
jgi:hypothetical protein